MSIESAGGRSKPRLTAVIGALVFLSVGCGTTHLEAVSFDSTPSVTDTDLVPAASSPSGPSASSPEGSEPASTAQATSTAAHFGTLPPGSTLPSDAECAARVRKAPEIRPANAKYNQTEGHPTPANTDPSYPLFARVTGAFTGTTDEIIQWVACKWGIDEDVVRAQAAKETYWLQGHLGDFGTDPTVCVPGHPIGADGQAGKCPQSIGILQTRLPYFKTTITDDMRSTAYDLDISYAVWRTCFEGNEQWLNTVERGQPYQAGDLWGCVGRWFAGRWYTSDAKQYIAAVQGYVKDKIWEKGDFVHFSGS